MIVKKRFTTEKWFEDKLALLDFFKLVRYAQNSSMSSFFIKEKIFYTLFIDLKRDIKDIFRDLKKGTRTNVNRAVRDGISWENYDTKNIDYFIKFSNTFRKSRGLSLLSLDKLSPYLDNMAIVRVFDRNNNTLVFLSFLVDRDKKRVRPFHVSSCITLTEEITCSLQEYANTYAYWVGIEHFKKHGFEIFDMGGVTPYEDDIQLSGITNFKMGFSSNMVVEYYFLSPLLYLLLKVKGIRIRR